MALLNYEDDEMAEVDHILTDEKMGKICWYCRFDISAADWESVHEGIKMYKITTCPGCKSELRVNVSFDGSGHDNWAGEKKIKIKNGIKDLDWFVLEKDPQHPKNK